MRFADAPTTHGDISFIRINSLDLISVAPSPAQALTACPNVASATRRPCNQGTAVVFESPDSGTPILRIEYRAWLDAQDLKQAMVSGASTGGPVDAVP